jgi:hypothetical protein
MVIPNFERRLAKLESGSSQANLPEWARAFSDHRLLADPSWRRWCSLEQFLIGRAASVAIWWRSLDSFAYWSKHEPPYWWALPAWQRKTPDFQERIDSERRIFCPPDNRSSFRAFQHWLYSDAPRCDSDRPENWCQPDIESYTWPGYRHWRSGRLPVLHAFSVAACTWLIDDLQLAPAQVRESATNHFCGFRWDLSMLAQVHPPGRAITGTSPTLHVAEMATWAKKHKIPVNKTQVKAADGIEILELLTSIPSGCEGRHNYEQYFPSIKRSCS